MIDFNIRDVVELGDAGATGRRIQNGQYLAASAVLRRLYGLKQPGAVLADEVGLGKTYVALGVAAWLLRERSRARVLILTNSRGMANAWADRWAASIQPLGWTKPDAQLLRGYEDYALAVKDPSCRLAVMSYESLKRFAADWKQIRLDIGAWLLQPRHRPGIHLRAAELAQLRRLLTIRANGRARKLTRSIPSTEARGWWARNFNPEVRELTDPSNARTELEDLELKYQPSLGGARRRYQFDLVIVDEAHRFDSAGRRQVIDLLLKGNVKKFLHVTATPFALSVSQLETLLLTLGTGLGAEDFATHEKAVAKLGLRDFERSVGLGDTFTGLPALEAGLRQWIVRRTWEEETRGSATTAKKRRTMTWESEPDAGEGFVATLALERAIAEMHRVGNQTHIASRRTSLCSSWSSALASLDTVRFGASRSPSERFRSVAVEALRPVARTDSPKVRASADRIAQLVRAGRKVLVFAERGETLLSLQRHLSQRLAREEHQARAHRKRVLAWYRSGRLERLRQTSAEYGGDFVLRALLASIAGEKPGRDLPPAAVHRAARAWLKESGENLERRGWLADSFEGGRSIRAVEVFDGKRGNQATVNRFNLPGTPWVLLCSKKAQESIDLHVECNTVVLFDPVWNPAHREQRIGRVQRIGSRFRTVDVVDVVTLGTYEEHTYKRAMQRARMMRVLLGAGKWLDSDVEIAEPDAYCVDLSPRSSLEKQLKREAGG